MDKFMQAAIEEARQGFAEDGIPIGSVLVHNGVILGQGHNRRGPEGERHSPRRDGCPGKCRTTTCQCLSGVGAVHNLVPVFHV